MSEPAPNPDPSPSPESAVPVVPGSSGDAGGPAPRLTRSDAAYVAKLARIDLTDDELDRYAAQLAVVLDHAAQVAAVDTAGRAPTAHPLALVNVLRSDEVRPSLDRSAALAAAPAVEDDRFRVPRIMGEAP